jgi:hypothetical protein
MIVTETISAEQERQGKFYQYQKCSKKGMNEDARHRRLATVYNLIRIG